MENTSWNRFRYGYRYSPKTIKLMTMILRSLPSTMGKFASKQSFTQSNGRTCEGSSILEGASFVQMFSRLAGRLGRFSSCQCWIPIGSRTRTILCSNSLVGFRSSSYARQASRARQTKSQTKATKRGFAWVRTRSKLAIAGAGMFWFWFVKSCVS